MFCAIWHDLIYPMGRSWEVVICPNAEETGLRNFGPVVHLRLSREDQEKLAEPCSLGSVIRDQVPFRPRD